MGCASFSGFGSPLVVSLQPVVEVGSAADIVPVQDWIVEDVADVDFGLHSLLEIKKGNPYGVGYPF